MHALNTKTTRLTALLCTIAVAVVVGSFIYVASQRKQSLRKQNEIAQLAKEQMEEELLQLQEEYGLQVEKLRQGTGYGEQYMHLSSDALLEELGQEKAKVAQLTEELRLTKASNSNKIKKLSDEVKSLRKVLRSYVQQVDSLYTVNTQLKKENESVKRSFEEASRKADKLSAEKEDLTQKVTLAEKLELKEVRCTPLDKRGRATNKLNRVTHLRFDFTILRNVSAKVGLRKVYIRLLNPNDMPITSSSAGAFQYEGSTLQATVSKQIEYGGDDLKETIYWNIEQTLIEGTYHADFFTDGVRIGRLTFQL